MAEAVSEFAAKWNLDAAATDFLRGLDEAAVKIVIAEFGPRGDTTNVASKLYAFARSVTGRLSTSAQLGPDLDSFIAKWTIDAEGASWLRMLDPKVIQVLLREFQPKEETFNPMGKLKAFARSIQQRQGTEASYGGSTMTASYGNSSMTASYGNTSYAASVAAMSSNLIWGKVQEFGTYWGIEDAAMQLLHSLPPDTQATVISQFDPKGDVHNVNGKLISFARSVAGGGGYQGSQAWGQKKDESVVNSFATYWGLDASTAAFLWELPEAARSTVIQEFDPKAQTSNVNGKLRMFAKGILARDTQTFAGKGQTASAGWGASTGGLDKSASGPDAASAAADYEATTLAAASTSDPAISTFVLKWQLDQSSVSLLEGLTESVRATVLEEFAPRGEIRNMGSKLRAFAHTVANPGKGKGGKGSTGGLDGQSGTSTSASAAEPTQEEEDAFLLKWDMQDNQQAKDVLKRLHGRVRGRVMQEFLPQEGTTNTFGKFCGFANSVQKAAAREAFPPTASYGYGAGYGASAAIYTGYAGAKGSASAGYGGNGKGKGYARASSSAEQFAQQWQLDEGSRAVLHGLPADVQAIVISEFQPRGDTRDVARKFVGFANSVAERGRGQKRPWPGGGPTQPTWR